MAADFDWSRFADLPTIPRHVAIIMDGNNRWARQKHLKGVAGHRAGVRALQLVVEGCARAGVDVLTLFAFSSENWQRPDDEVSGLLDLFSWALTKEIEKLARNDLQFIMIGDRTGFPNAIQRRISEAEARTANNQGMKVVVAANYGGRWDIAQAAQALAREVANGRMSPADIDEATVHARTALSELPDPDLCIRTAGECRLSNFLLWQFAYTELFFSPVLWPDFGVQHLYEAFLSFGQRQRRFGGRTTGTSAESL